MNNENFPRQLSKVKVTVNSNLNSIGPSLMYCTHIKLVEVGKDADARSASCLVSENCKTSYCIHLCRS